MIQKPGNADAEGRGIADEGWIQSSVSFNEWLKKNAQNTSPAITLINTTNLTPGGNSWEGGGVDYRYFGK